MNQYFQDIKVLLIGDFMADDYIFCSSTRMSPEAPVPVLQSYDKLMVPGGAGNVALNMSKLGANVILSRLYWFRFSSTRNKKIIKRTAN